MRSPLSVSRAPAGVLSLVAAPLVLGAALVGCSRAAPRLHFTDVSKEAGLVFEHDRGGALPMNLLMTMGGAPALFDYDGDGDLDAFLVNGYDLEQCYGKDPTTCSKTRHALFRNRGDGTFEDVTLAAGLGEVTFGQGCTVADYDGDGWPDLYVTNWGPNRLFRNRGDGTFEDVTEHAGVGDPRWSTGAVFFDLDGDLDLDLYVANYVKVPADAPPWTPRKFEGPRFYDSENDVVYRNQGDGTFRDVTEEIGLVAGGKGLGVMASDLDEDGDQDVFVANDRTANFLYENVDGKLVEIALRSGVAVDVNGSETAGMGVDIVDVDGDGRQDIHLTNFRHEFNNLFRNEGGLVFTDVAGPWGLQENTWLKTGWATRFVDFDLDGYLDAFLANGGIWDQPEGGSDQITYEQANCLFLGDGQGRFSEIAGECGDAFAAPHVSRGAAVGDYDGDGDLDILVVNSGEPAQLFRNDAPPSDRWLKVLVKGRSPNTDALGAKVEIRIGARTVRTEVRYAGTYISACDPSIHVGLRPGENEGTVSVRWPSGATGEAPVRAGTTTTIEEPQP